MPTVTVTYKAPANDSKVATMRDIDFFDGKPEKLDSEEHAALLAKLRNNPHFEVSDDKKSGN